MTQEIDIAALRKAAQGLRIAPLQPTVEMSAAGEAESHNWASRGATDGTLHYAVYQAMLTAAPEPAIDLNALLDRLEQSEKDAARWRTWRDSMCANDRAFLERMEAHIASLAPNRQGAPRPDHVDAAVDAATQGGGA